MSRRSILPAVFENAHYLLVNKPPGMRCNHSKLTLESRAENEVLPMLIDQYPGLKPVHRIDSRVTGGLLIARNRTDANMFSRYLKVGGNKGHKFKRRYVGITRAVYKFRKDDTVIFHNEDHTRGEIKTLEPNNTFSTTKFIRPDSGVVGDLQLIVMQLETGRKHQIRKHLSSSLALPIVNDTKYGSTVIKGDPNAQLGLHSGFVKTIVGSQTNTHFIPVLDGVDTLWKGFVDEQGHFNQEIKDILENFDERLIE